MKLNPIQQMMVDSGMLDIKPSFSAKDEPSVCEYDGDPRQWACMREEQCDDCFMKDHLKECDWCTEYDHTVRKLEVKWSNDGKMVQKDEHLWLK